MATYENIKNKQIIIANLPETVLNHVKERDVYFTTFTFKDTLNNPSPADLNDYFTAFFQNINNNSMNQKKNNYHKKCILIAFPEKSYKDTLQNKIALTHYHAFLLIHKENKERFIRRAVENERTEFYEALQKNVTILDLKSKLTNCLRVQNNNSYKLPLKLQTHSLDVRVLQDTDDIIRVSRYMTKSFKYNFTADDIQIYCNMKK